MKLEMCESFFAINCHYHTCISYIRPRNAKEDKALSKEDQTNSQNVGIVLNTVQNNMHVVG